MRRLAWLGILYIYTFDSIERGETGLLGVLIAEINARFDSEVVCSRWQSSKFKVLICIFKDFDPV